MATMLSPDVQSLQRDDFVAAMAQVACPVALITTGTLECPKGLTASAVCSLSADPPAIVICVNKTASAHDDVLRQKSFGANFLHAGQGELARRFAQKDVDRFAGQEWTVLATGAPILQSALVAFDCRLHAVIDGFSHSIMIGVVERILSDPSEGDTSLVWHRRRFCRATEI